MIIKLRHYNTDVHMQKSQIWWKLGAPVTAWTLNCPLRIAYHFLHSLSYFGSENIQCKGKLKVVVYKMRYGNYCIFHVFYLLKLQSPIYIITSLQYIKTSGLIQYKNSHLERQCCENRIVLSYLISTWSNHKHTCQLLPWYMQYNHVLTIKRNVLLSVILTKVAAYYIERKFHS